MRRCLPSLLSRLLRPAERRGFTLLELIVVIVILGLLAAIAVPTFARVMKTAELEAAEVTAGALLRNAQAISAFDSRDGITREAIETSADELPARVSSAPGVFADADGVSVEGTEVVFGNWEFSGRSRTISAKMDPESPVATAVGVAIWVPGAGCALGRVNGQGSKVSTWHYRDDEIDVANCNGIIGLVVDPDDPLPAGLRAPARPRITISENVCTTAEGESGRTVSGFEGAHDFFIGGRYVGTYVPGACVPGLDRVDVDMLDDEVDAFPNPAGADATSPAPRDGGIGSYAPGGAGGGPGGGSAAVGDYSGGQDSLASDGDDSHFVYLPLPSGGAGGEFVRQDTGSSGGGWSPVGVSPGWDREYAYVNYPAPSGSWRYGWQYPDGSVVPASVKPTTPPASDAVAEDYLQVRLLDGTVTVSWGAVPDLPQAPLSGYRLYRATAATEAEARTATAARLVSDTYATPGKSDTSYLDGPLDVAQWYCYALSAWGPGGDSGKSNIACVQLVPTDNSGGGTGGDGGTTPSSGSTVSLVSAGNGSSCAVQSGAAKCWGSGYWGQLGNGTSGTNAQSPVQVTDMTSGVTSVHTQGTFACGIQSGGVKCWGQNSAGQLGDGTTTNRSAPVQVTDLGSNVTSMSVGGGYACAVQNGGVKCWGNVPSFTTRALSPVAIPGLTEGVTAVATANSTACAVQGGVVKCWGSDAYGELGNGAPAGNSDVPVAVTGLGSDVTSLSAGWYHFCAAQSGALKCWGHNSSGQLGTGDKTNAYEPLVPAGMESGVTAAAASQSYSCAIQNGGVKCTNGVTPFTTVTGAESGVTHLSTGRAHRLAIQDGVVKAWGTDADGELGNGTGGGSSTPQPVLF